MQCRAEQDAPGPGLEGEESMRLSKIMAGLGLLAGAVGCHHTSGTCDCLPNIQPCSLYGLYPSGGSYNQAAPAATDTKPVVDTPKTTADLASGLNGPAGQPVKEQIDLPKDQY
jgi:hypothetical protein